MLTIRVNLDPHAYLGQLVRLLGQGSRRFLVRGLTPDALAFAALALPLKQPYGLVLHGSDRRADALCPVELLQRVPVQGSMDRDAAYDAVFVFATVGLDEVLLELDRAGVDTTVVVPDLPFTGPPIVLVSLPKAASSWIAGSLSVGLRTRLEHVSHNTFPSNSIDAFALDRVVREGLVTQDHLDASALNLQALRHLAGRCIVNVRDPRPALLSLAHFLTYRYRDNERPVGLLFVSPAPPQHLLSEPIAVQIDWYLEHHLPQWVRWIEDWVRVADAPGDLRVLLTEYGELVRGEERQLRRMIAFAGVPQGRFVMPRLERSMEATTFRRGDPTEWERVYTAQQRDRAAAAIPAALKARFGWPDW